MFNGLNFKPSMKIANNSFEVFWGLIVYYGLIIITYIILKIRPATEEQK